MAAVATQYDENLALTSLCEVRVDHLLRVTSIVVICCMLQLAGLAQSGGTTQYIYDANGRLSAVLSPSGAAAVYHYDAAGNLTSIEQIAAGSFSVISVSPQVGTVGDQVTLTGIGLDTAGSVSFNGTPAQILSASTNTLVTAVPPGASTGLITLSGARGSAVSPSAFTVVARVDITPATAEILPGESALFSASVVGTPDQTVTWAVNGIAGGNSTIGTIDSTGLYQSPTIDSGLTVAISATSELDNAVSGQATVRILNPESSGEVHANGVSVALGVVANFAPVALPLSVEIGPPAGILSSSLLVDVGDLLSASSLPVSVTSGPVIATISPGILVRGANTNVSVTGHNLGGTTAVAFLKQDTGALERNVTVSNLSVSPDGTTLTFTAAVSSTATAGTDILYVAAANGRSPTTNTGTNTVQLQ